MARTVRDAALMLQVIAGYDSTDVTSTDSPTQDYSAGLEIATSALRVGIPRAGFYEGLHPDIQAAMGTALSVLGELTSSTREIELATPNDDSILILKTEAFAFHRPYLAKSPELYQPDTMNRIRGGSEVTAAQYVDARRHLDRSRRSIADIFEKVDVIVTPTNKVPPFSIAELLKDPDQLRPKEVLTTPNTRPFNFYGLPSISVLCGFTSAGLPIGLQISGPSGSEAIVLRLAHAYERSTEWRKREPKVS
jgi:aspartyl-tRNA(Asn)/glutamyl-tRNA(Gln) amidotransferase subunit A